MFAACPVIEYGWIHIKDLERSLYVSLRLSNRNYHSIIGVSTIMRSEMHWWKEALTRNEGIKIVKDVHFALEIFSDASLTGWGAFCNNSVTHGFWHPKDAIKQINYLEILAAFNAIKSFASDRRNCSILLRLDNVTAIACTNRMGSVRFRSLHNITKEMWAWCEERKIFLVASYINTKENVHADRASRLTSIDSEYELSNLAFSTICDMFGTPTIDLFATHLNTKCPKYISWKPDPHSFSVDAFLTSWCNEFFYAFPPFNLLSKCIQKIIAEKSEGILVVPSWSAQPWYSIFRRLLLREPIIFTPSKNLLFSPSRKPPRLWKKLSLEAGILSGKLFFNEECPK